eukprot:5967028-Pyramimonas_sp.AAC.1
MFCTVRYGTALYCTVTWLLPLVGHRICVLRNFTSVTQGWGPRASPLFKRRSIRYGTTLNLHCTALYCTVLYCTVLNLPCTTVLYRGRYGSLQELILQNGDYLVDSLCRQLRHVDAHPHAPQLFAALLQHCGQVSAFLPSTPDGTYSGPDMDKSRVPDLASRRKEPSFLWES